jgi:ribose transport system substrate-binding protein
VIEEEVSRHSGARPSASRGTSDSEEGTLRSKRVVRWPRVAAVIVLASVVAMAAVGSASSRSSGESYGAKPTLLTKAFGTTKNIPKPVLAAVYRAGLPISSARLQLALKCWRENTCDTGTGGKFTVALADGFGENVWREVTHMEFVLGALTYPEIGKIIYTSGQNNTQKQISDFRSLIAQKVNLIIGFPDAGAALLPSYREATRRGITVVPYTSTPGGKPGKDYTSFVSEDLCKLGKNFAGVLNTQVKSGKVAFLGGTPGNGLSKAWQACERPALNKSIDVVGTADTNWTRQGSLQAMSGFLSKYPDLKGVSYEYADGFLGGVQAYQAAKKPLDLVLTLRTDEMGLFCAWKKINNPKFKIYYSNGGNFQSRLALTIGMIKLNGGAVPSTLIVPAQMRQVTKSTCNPGIPGQTSASTLVSDKVLKAMYKK